MANYGKEKRLSVPTESILYSLDSIRRTGSPVFPRPRLGHRKLETVMSFRTSSRGTFVPDHIADPYYHFLTMGNAKKIDKLEGNFTYPKTKRSEVLTGEKPSEKKHPPHVDNGHSFAKTDYHIETTANRKDYLLNWSRTRVNYYEEPYFRYTQYIGGPLYAGGAEISLLHQPRMLFKYDNASYPNYFGKISTDSSQDMVKHGQKAIATLAPNRPNVSLAAILGELREGLPSVIGMSLLYARAKNLRRPNLNAGGKKQVLKLGSEEYINLQFGIVPLMSDIRKIIENLTIITDRLRSYEVDSGNGVRRRMDLITKQENEVFDGAALSSQGYISCGLHLAEQPSTASSSRDNVSGEIKSFVTQQLTEKVWFSGSFTYFVPIGKDLSSNIDKYVTLGNKLLGLSPSVEALWQLAPWSWLSDWILDIGSTISAYERIKDDNLVINYGYVMATSIKKSTQHSTVVSPMSLPDGKQPSEVMSTVTSVRKERVRANPYGFSATSAAGLNLKQLSILGALGFSKLL